MIHSINEQLTNYIFIAVMVKRKQQADQPHNLKRFKGIIGRFTSEHADQEDGRSFQPAKKTPSRKEKRKEMRTLKKMQKNAFIQRKPVCILYAIHIHFVQWGKWSPTDLFTRSVM